VVIILDLLKAMEFKEEKWVRVCVCVCVCPCVRGQSGIAKWTGVNLCRYVCVEKRTKHWAVTLLLSEWLILL
jgi:hypothetical protein